MNITSADDIRIQVPSKVASDFVRDENGDFVEDENGELITKEGPSRRSKLSLHPSFVYLGQPRILGIPTVEGNRHFVFLMEQFSKLVVATNQATIAANVVKIATAVSQGNVAEANSLREENEGLQADNRRINEIIDLEIYLNEDVQFAI